MRYIPKELLIKGVEYRCNARNFIYGTWNGEEFEYMRYKFCESFPDTEKHWDDDPHFGTVKPLEVKD